MSDVVLLPGAALAPDVLLHQVLENMAGIKGVIVLKINEHGAVEVCNSRLSLYELAYAAMIFELYAKDCVSGNPPDGVGMFVPPGAA